VDSLTLIGEWDAFLAATGKSENTRHSYSGAMLRILSRLDPMKAVCEITETDLVCFLARIDYRDRSRVIYVNVARSFFSWAHSRGYVGCDPSILLSAPANPKEDPVALTPQELEAFLQAAYERHPRRRWALQLCYGLGTRRMELVAITPADVEPTQVHLRVTKGNHPRSVPIGPVAREALKSLEPWSNETVIGNVSAQTLTHYAQDAGRAAGLPARKCRAHILRATFVTRLLAEGVPPQVVMRLVGHQSLQTTTAYAACLPGAKEDAVTRL
jgi:integrase/recombinase XerD